MDCKQFGETDFGYEIPRDKEGYSESNPLYSTLASTGYHPAPVSLNNQPGSSGNQSAWVPLSNLPVEQNGSENPTRVRLRATNTKSTYSLKNVKTLKILVLVQSLASGFIMLSQVLMYATLSGNYYKPVLTIGIGLWAPILFFSVASGLSYLVIKSATPCTAGSAMGFQIWSVLVGIVLLVLSSISLNMHGYSKTIRNYNGSAGTYNIETYIYDPEIPGRVFCSLMILSAGAVVITGIFISVILCRMTCCGKTEISENIIFDVEMDILK